MKLFELFDEVADFHLEWDDDDGARYYFKFKPPNEKQYRGYLMYFYRMGGDSEDIKFFNDPNILKNNEIYLVSFMSSDGSDAITGTGSAYKVFSTVFKIIEDFKKRHPTSLLLVASKTSEPSRVKLYSRFFDNKAKHKWIVDPYSVESGHEIDKQTAWLI